jgi:hypothetical protein
MVAFRRMLAVEGRRLAMNEKLGHFGISKWRILLVNVVVLLLIFGHLFGIVTDKEHWPFSQYKLFTNVETERSLTRMQLYGVTQDGSYEFPLRSADERFDNSTVIDPIKAIKYQPGLKPEERQAKLNERLLDSLSTYERQRLAGDLNGPPLQGVRLYEATWSLDGQARSMDDPADQQELITEVRWP